MTLNCIIIDDEPLAAQLLASYAQKTTFLNLIGTFNSAVAAIKNVKEKRIDLIFLDIQMPELSALEFATLLPPTCKIVFTTAFSQYAIDGYKVNAIDYLLKPISYDDFLKAANKALDSFTVVEKKDEQEDRFIYVKSEYKLVRVLYDDILYIEGLKDYVKIYLDNNQRPIHSLMNMKTMEDYLPSPEFLRIHRSYIVHMPKVKAIDHSRLVIGENYLPVADSYKEELQQYLDSHTLM